MNQYGGVLWGFRVFGLRVRKEEDEDDAQWILCGCLMDAFWHVYGALWIFCERLVDALWLYRGCLIHVMLWVWFGRVDIM